MSSTSIYKGRKDSETSVGDRNTNLALIWIHGINVISNNAKYYAPFKLQVVLTYLERTVEFSICVVLTLGPLDIAIQYIGAQIHCFFSFCYYTILLVLSWEFYYNIFITRYIWIYDLFYLNYILKFLYRWDNFTRLSMPRVGHPGADSVFKFLSKKQYLTSIVLVCMIQRECCRRGRFDPISTLLWFRGCICGFFFVLYTQYCVFILWLYWFTQCTPLEAPSKTYEIIFLASHQNGEQ